VTLKSGHAKARAVGRVITVIAVIALSLVAGFGVNEWLGWPWLAGPLQSVLSTRLQRPVLFAAATAPAPTLAASAASTAPTDVSAARQPTFRLQLWGEIDLQAAQLSVGAPDWSKATHLLRAQDLKLRLRYFDLWRAWQGQALRIESLRARRLDARLERLADGRASWVVLPAAATSGKPTPEAKTDPPLLSFGELRVDQGSVHFSDEALALHVSTQLSLQPDAPGRGVMQAQSNGHYGKFPLRADWRLARAFGAAASKPLPVPTSMSLKATVGRASFAFEGQSADMFSLQGWQGQFSLAGPSLAAVGDPLGVTLPTTAAFRANGLIANDGKLWRTVINDASVGVSRLNGAFTYDRSTPTPRLAGRLAGSRLSLVDLGPAVGVMPKNAANQAQKIATGAGTDTGISSKAAQRRNTNKVLPDRPFDLPALRAMDANVLIDIQSVDLNTTLLEPLKPLRAHLVLTGGVLSINDIDARTAQGILNGSVSLDGRATAALWEAKLRWQGVQIERWIQQTRANAAPPFVAGQLNGTAKVQGRGRSTASILASLHGQIYSELRGGRVSHLAVEAAGLDIAQGLGMLIKGDDSLRVSCAVADFGVQAGVLRPRMVVLDTNDSVLWLDGSLSLVDESLDLRTVVAPRDISPLSLRSPLRLQGSFAQPQVSVQTQALGAKLGAVFLLGLINPLAALIPLVDLGDKTAANQGAEDCARVVLKARLKNRQPAQKMLG
jgi:AsmA family protein